MKLAKPKGTIHTLGDRIALEDTFPFAADIAARFGKTKEEKAILTYVLPAEPESIKAWWRVCKKDWSLARTAVIRLRRKANWEQIYLEVDSRHGCLKTPLLRYLEYRYFLSDKKGFVKHFFGHYAALGMSQEDVEARAVSYASRLEAEFTSRK